VVRAAAWRRRRVVQNKSTSTSTVQYKSGRAVGLFYTMPRVPHITSSLWGSFATLIVKWKCRRLVYRV